MGEEKKRRLSIGEIGESDLEDHDDDED